MKKRKLVFAITAITVFSAMICIPMTPCPQSCRCPAPSRCRSMRIASACRDWSMTMLTSNTKAQAAAKKTYTITPKSSPYKGKYKSKRILQFHNKTVFAIRSYLELLEKKGGGKISHKKGDL